MNPELGHHESGVGNNESNALDGFVTPWGSRKSGKNSYTGF